MARLSGARLALAATLVLTGMPFIALAVEPPRTVQDLMAAYGWVTDRHDLGGVTALFEEDAIVTAPRIRATARGRDEIAKMLAPSGARVAAGDQRRHLITGVRELGRDAEGIRFHATFAVIGTPAEGGPQAYATGYYEGIARETGDGLKFRQLTIAVDGPPPAP